MADKHPIEIDGVSDDVETLPELKNELQNNRDSLQSSGQVIEPTTGERTTTNNEGSGTDDVGFGSTEPNQDEQQPGVLDRPGIDIEGTGRVGLAGDESTKDNEVQRPNGVDTKITTKPVQSTRIKNKFQAEYKPSSSVNEIGLREQKQCKGFIQDFGGWLCS